MGEKITGDKLPINYHHVPHHEEEHATTLPTIWWKGMCGNRETSYTLLKKDWCLPCADAWTFLNKKLRIQHKRNKMLSISLKLTKNQYERIKIPLNACLILPVLKGKIIFLLHSKKWKDIKIIYEKFCFFNFKG